MNEVHLVGRLIHSADVIVVYVDLRVKQNRYFFDELSWRLLKELNRLDDLLVEHD